MDYVYNVSITVKTGLFRRRVIGRAGFDNVHFPNPVNKKDYIFLDERAVKAGGIYEGRVKEVRHLGRVGETDSLEKPESLIDAVYYHRSERWANTVLDSMSELAKLIKNHRGKVLAPS